MQPQVVSLFLCIHTEIKDEAILFLFFLNLINDICFLLFTVSFYLDFYEWCVVRWSKNSNFFFEFELLKNIAWCVFQRQFVFCWEWHFKLHGFQQLSCIEQSKQVWNSSIASTSNSASCFSRIERLTANNCHTSEKTRF